MRYVTDARKAAQANCHTKLSPERATALHDQSVADPVNGGALGKAVAAPEQRRFGALPPPKRVNVKGCTWSRAPRRIARIEDTEHLAYVAACWRREPTGLLSGRDVDRVRHAGRNSWCVADGYSWVTSPW